MVRKPFTYAGVACALAACTPNFTDTTTSVSAPRLLAVGNTPAEGPPGSKFTLRALYDDGNGPADAGSLQWATCVLQKPLGDPGSVNPACLSPGGAGLVPLGVGNAVTGIIPANACELFGPESPPPLAGQPSARPTDPDATGGYYLPIRVAPEGNQDSVAFERIACQPSGVVESVFAAFSAGYILNENPVVSTLAWIEEAGPATTISPDTPEGKPAITVTPGAVMALRVEWPSCPDTPAACGGAETYLLIDASTGDLATSRESMVASWYSSGGSFVLDRIGRDGSDPTVNVVNTWRAPTMPGIVRLWVVLRDARGGVGWESYSLDVER